MHYEEKDRLIIENFEDGTREGNPVVVAEVTRENPDYYGNLFAQSEAMLQVCKDINNLKNIHNLSTECEAKLKGIIFRAGVVLKEVGF
jgi:hypothetical protein